MKLVLANKNPNFYESNQDKYSYIKINRKEGNIDDNISVNKKQFLDTLFPDSSNFKDTFLFTQTSIFNYSITFNSQNFPPNIYPNTFEFYNNVSYLKFIFNNFELYFFVQNRQCLRYNTNQWTYTLRLDAYNSYWDKFYESFKSKYLTRQILTTRWHANRFKKINNDIVFSMLLEQNEFWNNDKFLENFINRLITKSSNTVSIWDEETKSGTSIIKNSSILANIYGDHPRNSAREQNTLFMKLNNNFVYAIYNPKINQDSGFNIAEMMNKFYGVTNIFIWTPILSDERAYPQLLPSDLAVSTLKINAGEVISSNFYIYITNLESGYLSSISSYPKPLVSIFTPTTIKWEDITYPLRTRDYFSSNLGEVFVNDDKDKDYNLVKIQFKGTTDKNGYVLSNYQGVEKQVPNTKAINEPQPLFSNIKSKLNTLCDERIPLEDLSEKLRLRLENQKIIQPRNNELEPNLYNDKILNIRYGYYINNYIDISLKYYFYNNMDDLLKYSSIFIQGYQFVQPQICMLTMGVVSGLYKEMNKRGEYNLSFQFNPQLQFDVDKENEFFANNRYSLNVGLTAGILKGAGNIAGISGATVGLANNQMNRNIQKGMHIMTGVASIETGGLFALANAGVNLATTIGEYETKLQDLSSAPATVKGLENSFNNLISGKPYYSYLWVNENDKQKIANYFNMQGYVCNKLITINSLATRLYFNYWEIPNIKSLINNDLIPLEIIDYFDKLFHNGIRLWHFDENGSNADLGNYDNENWELELLSDFTKEYSIVSTHNDITAQPINFQSEKKLKFISSKGDIKYGN